MALRSLASLLETRLTVEQIDRTNTPTVIDLPASHIVMPCMMRSSDNGRWLVLISMNGHGLLIDLEAKSVREQFHLSYQPGEVAFGRFDQHSMVVWLWDTRSDELQPQEMVFDLRPHS